MSRVDDLIVETAKLRIRLSGAAGRLEALAQELQDNIDKLRTITETLHEDGDGEANEQSE